MTRLDGDEVVADPLDLAEQVRRDDDRDPELGAGPPDEREHLVAPARVEAVGRLVEEQQPRIVDERLGELHALLHAGRVAADRPVPLLEQPDVAQDLGGPLPGGRGRQPGHLGEVRDELGRRVVGRQRVVLGHVADELADAGALAGGVEVHDLRARRRSAGSSPSRILSSVLLPAPFAPTSPMIPGSSSRLSASRAVTPGNRLVSRSRAMSAMGSGWTPGTGADGRGSGPERRTAAGETMTGPAGTRRWYPAGGARD